jgi:hypothetical protein
MVDNSTAKGFPSIGLKLFFPPIGGPFYVLYRKNFRKNELPDMKGGPFYPRFWVLKADPFYPRPGGAASRPRPGGSAPRSGSIRPRAPESRGGGFRFPPPPTPPPLTTTRGSAPGPQTEVMKKVFLIRKSAVSQIKKIKRTHGDLGCGALPQEMGIKGIPL